MTRAPAARARSPLPSVEPLSTTITSPAKPVSLSTARAAPTHSAIVSASSRQGMTTDTRHAGDAGTATAALTRVSDALTSAWEDMRRGRPHPLIAPRERLLIELLVRRHEPLEPEMSCADCFGALR